MREIGACDGAHARHEIDASGRYVVPGFIDAHLHADAVIHEQGPQLALLRQGVTTVVLGQDGLSFAPATPAALAWVSRYFAAVNGYRATRPEETDSAPSDSGQVLTVAELLDGYRGTTAVNTVYLVPHGTVRYSVMRGSPKAPDEDQLAAMVRLVEEGIDQGAAGISSGLGYLPGRFATVHELAALCAPAARRGLPYVTHMRGYGRQADLGMVEACAIGREARTAVHVSHYHGPSAQLVGLVDAARRSGIDITFDTYPYGRGCSILARMLPDWFGGAELDHVLDRLTDRGARRRFAAESDPAQWRTLTLSHVPSGSYRWAIGMRISDAADAAGVDPADLCADVLVDTALDAGVVIDFSEDEESIRELLRHNAHMGGSDGIYIGEQPHPRGYGTFARLIRRHVIELGDWTWEEAVMHLSARPAARFRLHDRGTIALGQAADLIVIDPAAISDHATYIRPFRLATGIDDVVVAGIPVLYRGHLTGRLPGVPLYPG
ncbi:N-acyl-D-amino-acid deacylase family protein [Nocardia sp. NBC_01327]|uniref:N-acyl-D-amino-acid deacylase family protein n=1 Tax=Nocardia sp. NBC_01327 TaxID=2903593 RepID=UPI002E1351AA|nr:amidohydrolase family protein [Nocardia sp. NBC_01327]